MTKMLAHKQNFILISPDSTNDIEFLNRDFKLRANRTLQSISGLNPEVNLSSNLEEGLLANYFNSYFNFEAFLEVPYLVPFNRDSIFNFLSLGNLFYKFILSKYLLSCKKKNELFTGSTKSNFTNLKKLFAILIPSELREYSSISSWMESKYLSIVFVERGGRFSVFDTKFKILLEDISSDDRLFAFIGDETLLDSEFQLKKILKENNIKEELFLSLDEGFSWESFNSSSDNNYFEEFPDLGEFLIYLKSLESNIEDSKYNNTLLESPIHYSNIDIPANQSFIVKELLVMEIDDLSRIFSASNNKESLDTFECYIKLLTEIGFGKKNFLSKISELNNYEKALLSFINTLNLKNNTQHFLFNSYFSGLPLKYQEQLLKCLKLFSFEAIIIDENKSILNKIKAKLKILNSSDSKLINNKKYKLNKITTPNSGLFLSSNSEILASEENRNLFFDKLDKNSIKSFIYIDFLEDRRKNNSYYTIGSFSGILAEIRNIYVKHPLSRINGLREKHFSYLSNLGRCNVCSGTGRNSNLLFTDILCSNCSGGRLDPSRFQIKFNNITFKDIHLSSISSLKSFFNSRIILKEYLSYFERLDLLELSLGDELRKLTFSDYKKLYLIKLINKMKSKSTCIILNGFFRGVSFNDAKKIIPFTSEIASKGAFVILNDPNLYLPELLSSEYIVSI